MLTMKRTTSYNTFNKRKLIKNFLTLNVVYAKKRKVDDYDRFRELLLGCESSNNRIIEDHLGASLAKGN